MANFFKALTSSIQKQANVLANPSLENVEDVYNPISGTADPGLALAGELFNFDLSSEYDRALGGKPPGAPAQPAAPGMDDEAILAAQRRAYQPRGRLANMLTSGRGLFQPELTARASLLGG